MDMNTELNDLLARKNALNQALKNTDYKAIKASEGSPGADWGEIQPLRQAWRTEINEIDDKIAGFESGGGEE